MKGGIRKRGNSWYYYFDLGYVNGKRKRLERVAKGATSKSEAERILRDKIREYENAGHVFTPTEITVEDFFAFWMREYVEMKLKPNSVENYRITIKKHVLPVLGKYKLRSLTPHVLQEFLNNKIREGYSYKTVSIIKGILTKSLRQAVYPYKFINETPMQYVELIMSQERKPTKEKLKILTENDLKVLFSNIKEGHAFYIPFMIGYFCGVRVGELCGLEWKHIDFREGTVTIEQQMTKEYYQTKDGKNKALFVVSSPKSKASYREIAVSDSLLEILKKERTKQKENQLRYGEHYAKDSQYDFVCKKENGESYTPNVIKWITRRFIKEELGIDFNYHSLRHTLATTLIENGVETKTVQSMLGHSRSSITQDTYTHLTEKMTRRAADTLDSLFKSL
ncbi:tyrosine-type recombinase/integrase [Paenisporosarcina cavernae]|uniref:Site-specific integrase n=1 Tax=Paenisporosarcina cavernae TaxID=2320858 RepID=A0A385YUT0_9BACL|nr:site-specific integrase [Paenisporosarcina cavernae]AYC29677.1 site-specific integrase [Paenisporosarcina cavernae]